MEVVIEVRAGADDEVDEPALHHLDDAAPKACRSQRARDGEPDGRVVLGQEHPVGEDPARLAQARGVERLESFVDQVVNVGASTRTVVADWLSRQVLLAGLARGTGRAVGHRPVICLEKQLTGSLASPPSPTPVVQNETRR